MSGRPKGWIKVKINEATGCWEWQGVVDGYGMPLVTVNQRVCRARYVYYENATGVRPDKLWHKPPENLSCVNPDHMTTVKVKDTTDLDRRLQYLRAALISPGMSIEDKAIINAKINELEAVRKEVMENG
jgi:hypothetical protein